MTPPRPAPSAVRASCASSSSTRLCLRATPAAPSRALRARRSSLDRSSGALAARARLPGMAAGAPQSVDGSSTRDHDCSAEVIVSARETRKGTRLGPGALRFTFRWPRYEAPARRHGRLRPAGQRRAIDGPQRQVPPRSAGCSPPAPRSRTRCSRSATHPTVIPNVAGTAVGAARGMALRSQNRWPTLKFDVASLLQAGGGLLWRGLLLQDLHVALVACLRAAHPQARGPRRGARRRTICRQVPIEHLSAATCWSPAVVRRAWPPLAPPPRGCARRVVRARAGCGRRT